MPDVIDWSQLLLMNLILRPFRQFYRDSSPATVGRDLGDIDSLRELLAFDCLSVIDEFKLEINLHAFVTFGVLGKAPVLIFDGDSEACFSLIKVLTSLVGFLTKNFIALI